MKRLILILSVLFSFHDLFAHDLWIEEDGGTFKLMYGHKHSSHGGDTIMEYKPEYVKYIKCLKGQKTEDIAFESKYPVSFNRDCDAVYIMFSSGYWTKTVYGTKNVSKENEKQVIKSWLSFESVKYCKNLSLKQNNPMTEDLEIVPISDLSKTKTGDKLRLRVFYKGKPAKDVVVAYDEKPRGTTDSDGNINISIKKSGFQIISASLTEKEDGVKADERIITTNLNFFVKE